MKWLELHLDTQPAGIDPAPELLSEYGIDSLMIDEEGDFKDFLENNHQYWDYVDEDLMKSMHGKSRITFYLEDSAEGMNTLAQFRIGLSAFKKQHPEYAPLILSMENVEDADWENNWKQFYKPMEIGERLLVVPEWEQAQEDGRVKLVLNPGLTFGTGSHATTRLCLQALEQHIHGGEKVLDLGCGSGILSIAALLLGAQTAFGVDIDKLAVKTANANALAEARFVLADIWLSPQTRPTTPAQQRARNVVFQQMTHALGLDLLTDAQAAQLVQLCTPVKD